MSRRPLWRLEAVGGANMDLSSETFHDVVEEVRGCLIQTMCARSPPPKSSPPSSRKASVNTSDLSSVTRRQITDFASSTPTSVRGGSFSGPSSSSSPSDDTFTASETVEQLHSPPPPPAPASPSSRARAASRSLSALSVLSVLCALSVTTSPLVSVSAAVTAPPLHTQFFRDTPSVTASLASLFQSGPVTDHNLASRNLLLVPSDNPILTNDLGWEWPHAETYPFTTRISTVRCLGGWSPSMIHNASITDPSELDVAYRNNVTGRLEYRFDVLFSRFDRWVQNGIALTVVLDNTLYAFVDDPMLGTYGVMSAPSNFTEYEEFIHTIASALVSQYGQKTAETWAWRVGTEPNNNHGHWNSSAAAYVNTYRAAVKGVRRVLPSAPVGVGNWAPMNHANLTDPYSSPFVDAVAAAFAAAGPDDLPLDFVAASMYGSALTDSHGVTDYSRYLPVLARNAGEFLLRFQIACNRTGRPMLFEEYGMLQDPGRVINPNPGAFGGAWRIATAAEGISATATGGDSHNEEGVSGFFRWGGLSRLPTHAGQPINFLGSDKFWISSVFWSHFRDTARVAAVSSSPPSPSPNDVNAPLLYTLLATSRNGSAVGLVSSLFAANESVTAANVTLSVAFPCSAAPSTGRPVQQLTLDTSSAPLDVMYRDLRAVSGGLAHALDHYPYPYPDIASSPAGVDYVAANVERYLSLQRESLTAIDFRGEIVFDGTAACHAKWMANVPSVSVLVF